MADVYKMAEKGRVYLFGKRTLKANPIHGEDLATVCVDAINILDKEILVGGPETFTHQEIALTAFEVLGSEPKISYVPEWLRTSFLRLLKIITKSKTYGLIKFL